MHNVLTTKLRSILYSDSPDRIRSEQKVTVKVVRHHPFGVLTLSTLSTEGIEQLTMS